MNKTVFGSSESALILAEILKKHPTERKKISASFNEYNQIQNEIVGSNLSVKLKRHMLKVILDRFKAKLNRCEGEVKTFSHNVFTQIYRKHLNSLYH